MRWTSGIVETVFRTYIFRFESIDKHYQRNSERCKCWITKCHYEECYYTLSCDKFESARYRAKDYVDLRLHYIGSSVISYFDEYF